ncbi:hypothetical protein [Rhizobium mesoamericanum]|uniref:hypothetical protein n=1 Tax=Rhizobium mesoamericanum TaxID=1079800 RepID=UPI00040DA67D|nr:hypothetical protein [Rhizobium mesoamericanum]
MRAFLPRIRGAFSGNLVCLRPSQEQPEALERVAARSRLITISAKVGIAPVLTEVVDGMGECDLFGALNLRPDTAPFDLRSPATGLLNSSC